MIPLRWSHRSRIPALEQSRWIQRGEIATHWLSKFAWLCPEHRDWRGAEHGL